MATVIKLRRDTLANWELNNPVLAEGEQILVIDGSGNALYTKIGNGTTNFIDLPKYTDDNLYTKDEIDTNFYDKTETDTNFYDKSTIDTNFYDKTEIDALASNSQVFMSVYSSVGQTLPSGYGNIYYDVLEYSKNCSHHSNYFFIFHQTGYYQIHTGFRVGNGVDVWTYFRMANIGTGSILGSSHGAGNQDPEPGTATYSFIFKVTAADVNASIALQSYRLNATLSIATSATGKSLNTTLYKIGDL